MTTQEQIAVMQAYADGREIEYKDLLAKEWCEVRDPVWNWQSNEYRVKAREPRRIWVNDYGTHLGGGHFTSWAIAFEAMLPTVGKQIEFVEVIR